MSAIYPFSAKPDTPDKIFPYWGGSGNDSEGWGVMASVDANTTLKLRFKVPPTLPSGTCKLDLDAVANATSGSAKVNPKWASVATNSTEDPDGFTLNAEGTTTITWAAGEANEIKNTKITLDADTPTAAEWIVMDLVFETTSWTLAQISTWFPRIIFE